MSVATATEPRINGQPRPTETEVHSGQLSRADWEHNDKLGTSDVIVGKDAEYRFTVDEDAYTDAEMVDALRKAPLVAVSVTLPGFGGKKSRKIKGQMRGQVIAKRASAL